MATQKREWIDVSVPLKTGMAHWPDNPPVKVERTMHMEDGDSCNVSVLSMGSHTGTHMDSPYHFVADGMPIDQMPLEVTLGPCRVIEIKDRVSIEREELERHKIKRGERVLFKTLNSRRCWGTDEFVEDFVYIARDGAAHLAERGVLLVGVDYLSVGGFKEDGVETHHNLLHAGIWIIEGLDLSKVKPGSYDLACLPLRILQGDGAPARAALRPRR